MNARNPCIILFIDNTTTKGRKMKNAQISAAILANVAKGMDLPTAYDAVFGEGAYIKMAGDIYDALRAKAAA